MRIPLPPVPPGHNPSSCPCRFCRHYRVLVHEAEVDARIFLIVWAIGLLACGLLLWYGLA
jgi:hypothetical protein